MNPLIRQAIVQGLVGLAFCIGVVFLSAGTWHYWQGWVFLAVFSALATGFTVYLAIYDKPLLGRRMKAGPRYEKERSQQIIVVAYSFVFWVIRTNSWAAANVRVEADQKVIDTGPYAFVRHPMYAGAIWLFIAIPLALGSWWTLVLVIPVLGVLVWRLLDEERILARDLRGYTDYKQRVRYRLVPHVW